MPYLYVTQPHLQKAKLFQVCKLATACSDNSLWLKRYLNIFCICVYIYIYLCLQSYLKITLCPRHLGLSSDRLLDCFPYAPRRRRVLRTPSSLCLSKWGAASFSTPRVFGAKTRLMVTVRSSLAIWALLRPLTHFLKLLALCFFP